MFDVLFAVALIGFILLGLLVRARFVRPAPEVAGVTPSRVDAGRPGRATLHGRHFQPFFRVFLTPGGQSQPMDIENPYKQEVKVIGATSGSLEFALPDLAVGVYDLYLYDEFEQLAVMSGALSVAVPAYPRATTSATVRLFLWPEVIARIRPGDTDTVPATTPAALRTTGAVVTAVRPGERITDEVSMRIGRHDAADKFVLLGARTHGQVLDVAMRLPVVMSEPGRWTYKGERVRAGEPFLVETAAMKWLGTVIAFDEPVGGEGGAPVP
jgi:hypothetical protein